MAYIAIGTNGEGHVILRLAGREYLLRVRVGVRAGARAGRAHAGRRVVAARGG